MYVCIKVCIHTLENEITLAREVVHAASQHAVGTSSRAGIGHIKYCMCRLYTQDVVEAYATALN